MSRTSYMDGQVIVDNFQKAGIPITSRVVAGDRIWDLTTGLKVDNSEGRRRGGGEEEGRRRGGGGEEEGRRRGGGEEGRRGGEQQNEEERYKKGERSKEPNYCAGNRYCARRKS